MKSYSYRRAVMAVLLAFTVMTAAAGCSTDQYNLAAKSIITAQEIYDATMSAGAEAYKTGLLSESGKAEIIKYGAVAHDGIALAQESLLAALEAGTGESGGALKTALSVMKNHLFELIDKAVSLGVSVSDTVNSYREEK